MLVIFFVIIIFLIIKFCFSSTPESTGSNTTPSSNTDSKSSAPPALSVQVSPTKPFDATNPYEIYDVVHLLSAIVAQAGDSWLIVYLQDENLTKGWPKAMGLSVTIDRYFTDRYQVDFSSYSGFVKLGLPLPAAKYLASVPFTVSGNDLKFDFPIPLDYPCSYSRFIVEEMEKGSRSSSYVQHGLRRITIEDRKGIIECKSD